MKISYVKTVIMEEFERNFVTPKIEASFHKGLYRVLVCVDSVLGGKDCVSRSFTDLEIDMVKLSSHDFLVNFAKRLYEDLFDKSRN